MDNIDAYVVTTLDNRKFIEATWTDDMGQKQIARGFPKQGWFYEDMTWVPDHEQIELNRYLVAYELWHGMLPVKDLNDELCDALGIPKEDADAPKMGGLSDILDNLYGPRG